GRNGAVIPNALEIGLPPWCPGRFPQFRRDLRLRIRRRDLLLLTTSSFRNRNEAENRSDDYDCGQQSQNPTVHASLPGSKLVSAVVEIITILAKNIPIEQLKFRPAMKDNNFERKCAGKRLSSARVEFTSKRRGR